MSYPIQKIDKNKCVLPKVLSRTAHSINTLRYLGFDKNHSNQTSDSNLFGL